MAERESVQCLLDEDIVHKRLDDLGQSRDAGLASVFSRAFPHLLLSSGSTALFVEQDARPLYSEGTLYPKKHEYAIYDHPLKSKDYDDRHFWIWVDNFVENQPASKLASLAVIEFLARAISTVHGWSDSAHRPAVELRRSGLIAVWEQRPGEAYERQEDLQARYLTVQQQRVETFKGLIDVNWDVPLGFPHSETTIRPLLLMLAGKRDERGWGLVARTSIDLLCWFDRFEDTATNSNTTQDTRKDNRLRCTRALSNSLQAVVKEVLLGNDITFWSSTSLNGLVEHLERVVERGLNTSADSYHGPILSSWQEIRDTLGEPSKYLAEGSHLRDRYLERFKQVYPRLKRAFDAIDAAIKKVPTVPNIDVNPADPLPLPTNGADLDRMGFKGIAEVVTAKSGASAPGTPIPDALNDKGKGRDLTDAGKDSRSQVSGTSHPQERLADDVSEPTDDEKE
ncbi:hypothetical protein FRC00_006314 [Tulasnella sp. 408]|nr:hypothetical protein FRC00_006314 [Tulasnella sp. 408]